MVSLNLHQQSYVKKDRRRIIMFIVSGTRVFGRNRGTSEEYHNCGTCRNTERFRVISELRVVTFFWIPILPYWHSYYLVCPRCNARYKIKRAQAMELMGKSK